jgi:hypothetical protein
VAIAAIAASRWLGSSVGGSWKVLGTALVVGEEAEEDAMVQMLGIMRPAMVALLRAAQQPHPYRGLYRIREEKWLWAEAQGV